MSKENEFPALLTDLYQLTMACAYWKSGMAETEAVFEMIFREQPFQGGFSVGCGLHDAITWIDQFRFSESDLSYLGTLEGSDGTPLFEPAFLEYLREFRFGFDLDAIPEGTVVFPQEPLVRVRGPLLHCQLLETPLLNIMNFQTLVATKAARICLSAEGDPVLEFGLRRAQGNNGGLSASRAAFVGGCAATSNVLAGKLLGIPVRGTHAHSWVMAFDTERAAFDAWAAAMPHNTIFLVDTYDSIEGVRLAIRAGEWLRERGHALAGVRLDSGDLAWLSVKARELLDAAGFPDTAILASNDLDEHIIASLKMQGAAINLWGVGTKLVTAYDHPALGGVYKLTALKSGGRWVPKLKLSETSAKISTPGVHQVRRFYDGDRFAGDAIYDIDVGISEPCTIIDPTDPARMKMFPTGAVSEDLLAPIFRGGRRVYDPPALTAVRERCQRQLAQLDPGVKRLLNPHRYPCGLERSLHQRKTELAEDARRLRNTHAQPE
jgi:nicotinate phosphoribosyltransferase